MHEISLSQISTYRAIGRKRNDYSLGGFYLITTLEEQPLYVGKSIHLMLRLKDHYYNATRNGGLSIDKYLYSELSNARFFIIDYYERIGINFFTKNLDTVVENYYIGKFNTNFPNGLNMVHYDKLRLK